MSLLLNLFGLILSGVNGDYIRSSIEMTYYDAVIYCEREYNTGLVLIKDNNANNDVLSLCNNNTTCWIGNNDDSINSYNNWNQKTVNKVGLSECPAMIAGKNGEWANVKCNNKYIAICDSLIKSVNKSRRLGYYHTTLSPTGSPVTISPKFPTVVPTRSPFPNKYSPTTGSPSANSPTIPTVVPTRSPFPNIYSGTTVSPTIPTLGPTRSPFPNIYSPTTVSPSTNSPTIPTLSSGSLTPTSEFLPYLSCCDNITSITVPRIPNNILIWGSNHDVYQLTFYVYMDAEIKLDISSIINDSTIMLG